MSSLELITILVKFFGSTRVVTQFVDTVGDRGIVVVMKFTIESHIDILIKELPKVNR